MEEQNRTLDRPISFEEVEGAVMEMPNGKSPGPDGFTAEFFKVCWDIVKVEVWEVVSNSHQASTLLKSLNSTFITLILKEAEANKPDKFRPIDLCNVLYKII